MTDAQLRVQEEGASAEVGQGAAVVCWTGAGRATLRGGLRDMMSPLVVSGAGGDGRHSVARDVRMVVRLIKVS